MKPFKFETIPLFVDQFDDNPSVDFKPEWKSSQSAKDGFGYSEQWNIATAKKIAALKNDHGLVLERGNSYYAIAAGIEHPVSFDGTKPLIFQFEVKWENRLNCSGAYLRLVSERDFDYKKFDDKTAFSILFGPDVCGDIDQVLFTFTHRNLKTGELEQKRINNPPKTAGNTSLTSQYRLIIEPDNSFQIFVNDELVRSGSLLTDFEPSVNPPKMIDDPKSIKPANWDDREFMEDPKMKRPKNLNEGISEFIPDSSVKKPEGWLEDEPPVIPDDSQQEPTDWNELEQGAWVQPMKVNPKCTVGCGKWSPPLIKNPNFVVWKAPMIKNPKYNGQWKPSQIFNPEYYEDPQPNRFHKVSAVGIEVWTVEGGVMFDNILLTHDKGLSDRFTEATWKVKNKLERKQLEDLLGSASLDDHQKESIGRQTYDWINDCNDSLNLYDSILTAPKELLRLYRDEPEEFKTTVAKPVFISCILMVISAILIRAFVEKIMATTKKEPVKKGKKVIIDEDDDDVQIPGEIRKTVRLASPIPRPLPEVIQKRERMFSSPLQFQSSFSAPPSPSHIPVIMEECEED